MCVNGIDKFACYCLSGYSGVICQIENGTSFRTLYVNLRGNIYMYRPVISQDCLLQISLCLKVATKERKK